MEQVIVPDTIEPVEGWKALRVTSNGSLYSPQQSFLWPARERAEADCLRGASYRWTPRAGKPAEERDPRRLMIQPTGQILTNTAVPFVTTSSITTVTALVFDEATDPDGPPKTELPNGMHWSWEPFLHEPAGLNECTCGIYMVDDPTHCGWYIDNDTLLARIYGWGNVIQGDQGSRVQYAYPQQLVAPERLREEAAKAALMYGIPVEVVPNSAQQSTKLVNFGPAQPKAQAQLHAAHAAMAQIPIPEKPPPPATPFVKAALVSLVASIVTTTNFFVFLKDSSGETLGLISMCACIFATLMLLFIDFMIFCSEEKARKA